MNYAIKTETYTPDGVYPIATMPSTLHLPDQTVGTMREAFRRYGGMLTCFPPHTTRNPSPHRMWQYRKTTPEYIHITTITEQKGA